MLGELKHKLPCQQHRVHAKRSSFNAMNFFHHYTFEDMKHFFVVKQSLRFKKKNNHTLHLSMASPFTSLTICHLIEPLYFGSTFLLICYSLHHKKNVAE